VVLASRGIDHTTNVRFVGWYFVVFWGFRGIKYHLNTTQNVVFSENLPICGIIFTGSLKSSGNRYVFRPLSMKTD
jgi:hypothetical protein